LQDIFYHITVKKANILYKNSQNVIDFLSYEPYNLTKDKNHKRKAGVM